MDGYSNPPVGVGSAHYNGNSNNPYVYYSPVHGSSSSGKRPTVKLIDAFSRCGKSFENVTRKAEAMADSFWNHLKTSPSISDAALARIASGTKVLTEGGHDKVFQQTFGNMPGEKLLHSYACYLSAAFGPVIGMLYISNKRIAFCSDHAYPSSPGVPEWSYHKVVIQIEQLVTINPSSNRWNPSEKYIHVVTRDGHEFWFMGFISFDKALKNLRQAIEPTMVPIQNSSWR